MNVPLVENKMGKLIPHQHPLNCPTMALKRTSCVQTQASIFAGTIFVKNPGTKVWFFLYTCYLTRAVHLDVVPVLLISDNAKTFKSVRVS